MKYSKHPSIGYEQRLHSGLDVVTKSEDENRPPVWLIHYILHQRVGAIIL